MNWDNCMNLCMIGELRFMWGLGMCNCGLYCDWCIVFMEMILFGTNMNSKI